ncbi:MAG: tol-pal system protein YbgF [Pseudodesulfovibrio sp.]
MQYLKLALFAATALLLVGCTAAKQDSGAAKASIEWRIQSLEESFLNFREEQRRQADQAAEEAKATDQKLADIQSAMDALKDGREASAAPDDMAVKEDSDKAWATDLQADDGGWVEGNTPPDKPVAQSGEAKPWAEVPGPPARIPEPAVIERDKPVAKSAGKAAAKSASSKPAGAQAVYDAAYAKYDAGEFDAARAGFDSFLKKFPKNGLVPNALYWKGETYYSQKNFPQAILAFKEVTGRFPKHAKAAAALLKIGMSYDRVGDPDNAIFYLRALVEDFPNSGPADIGRKELTRLGG